MFKEILADAFPVVEKFAPLIASAIGTPAAGGATLLGMHLLASAFGVNPAHLTDLNHAVSTNPDSQNILQNLNDQYGETLKSAISKIPMPTTFEASIKLTWPIELTGNS